MYWGDKAAWIEVSLTVTPELAEAVAELLARFTREGVVIEQRMDEEDGTETPKPSPFVRVFGYFFADAGAEEKKMRIEEALWHLGRIQPLPTAEYRLIKDENWMDAWKKHYQPIAIGRNLIILPAWMKKKYPGRIPIRINPGMAFGTGAHPSTQLCLELLETFLQPGMTVMDIGCGSGILSIAAAKMGAERVIAVDIDAASVNSTRENAKLNHVLAQVETAQGSVNLIQSGRFGVVKAHLVAANILAPVILDLLDEGLAELAAPDGYFLFAGILADQADEIIAKAAEFGLVHKETRRKEDWVALVLRQPAS